MTKSEILFSQLERGAGTCRQLADRTSIKLSTVRTVIHRLKKNGFVRAKEKCGRENVWVVVDVM